MDSAGYFAIEARGLTKTVENGAIRVDILRGIDFKIATGEFVAVTGPCGCGKTTFLHLLAGLDQPTVGTLRVWGEDLTSVLREERPQLRKRRIGLVPQAQHLVDFLSALENVGMPLTLSGMASHDVRQRSMVALEKVGLGQRSRHRPADLSPLDRQRVAIARALAADPAILLADESTSQLDDFSSRCLMDLFRILVRDTGLTLLMATRDPACANLADREVQISGGLLREAGSFSPPSRSRAA